MSRELTAKDMQGKTEPKAPPPHFWCDDAFGCKKKKDIYEFSIQRKLLHSLPDLCDQCVRGMMVVFGVNPAQFGMLHLIRHQEKTLTEIAKNTIKDRDISGALTKLKAGEVSRFRQYLESLEKVKTPNEIINFRAAYVTWWWQQIGVDYTPAAGGIKTVSGAAVPVGDR